MDTATLPINYAFTQANMKQMGISAATKSLSNPFYNKEELLVKVKYVDPHGAQTERCPFFLVKMQSTRGGLGLNIQSISMLI